MKFSQWLGRSQRFLPPKGRPRERRSGASFVLRARPCLESLEERTDINK